MFLRCSYFFGNLSLNVLINMVLTQKKECIQTFCNFFVRDGILSVADYNSTRIGVGVVVVVVVVVYFFTMG